MLFSPANLNTYFKQLFKNDQKLNACLTFLGHKKKGL
jgi:hypothetical protein